MPTERKLCESINNMAFVSSGYFDYNTLMHFVLGFIAGLVTGVLICNF